VGLAVVVGTGDDFIYIYWNTDIDTLRAFLVDTAH
jgi:hypothetical protein